MAKELAVVCGGGGFIGGHLAKHLLAEGKYRVRVVDIKPPHEWYQRFGAADNRVLDLRLREACDEAVEGATVVYNLAADMGGMGFIENNRALCMLSVLINTHLLLAAKAQSVKKYFYASSACVYAGDKQTTTDNPGLREQDAYPAMPEDGYGWEKLFCERMCRHFYEDYGLDVRIARFHNIYGPYGTYDGGREKAPAAVSRKVHDAIRSGKHQIEIWGDGKQTRSFTYIDDCVTGIEKLMKSEFREPINLGSSEMVTINELVSIVEDIGNIKLERKYNLSAPKGVRGRNSDNTLIQKVLGWEPGTSLQDGLTETFRWIGHAMDNGWHADSADNARKPEASNAGKSETANASKPKAANAGKAETKKGAKDSSKNGRRSLVGKA
jgi:nucleoside-diphosphate-sugar epimerase